MRRQSTVTIDEETRRQFDMVFGGIGDGMYFDRQGRPISMVDEQMLRIVHPGYERVGDDIVDGRFGPIRVSTVWLGMDHSFGVGRPRIFETMTFSSNDDLNLTCWRYATLREAEIGHRQVRRLTVLLQREPRVLVKPNARRWRR